MNRNTRKKWTLAAAKAPAANLKAYNLAVTRAEVTLDAAKKAYTESTDAIAALEQKARTLRGQYDIAMAATPTDEGQKALEEMRDIAMTYGDELQRAEIKADKAYAARKNAQMARNLAIRKKELFVEACPVSVTKLLKVAAKTGV